MTNAFKWANADAAAIARRSCYDCHSNETRWWWATYVAPFSWLEQHDVNAGRGYLNFSTWNGGLDTGSLRAAIDGRMPPWQYTLIHPSAKLSAAEKKTLIDGYAASLSVNQASSPSPSPSSSPSSTDTAVAIINARCGSCHSTQVALDYRATSTAQASQMIDNMVSRGASVSAHEEQVLIQYFTRLSTKALLYA